MPHTPEIEQKIRERAYEIYEYRRDIGNSLIVEDGFIRELTALDDWLYAEQDILDG